MGLSNYHEEEAKRAIEILKELGIHCLIHQPRYNIFERWIESGLQDVLKKEGVGSIAFSPLAQGLLTGRYSNGIPEDSRAAKTGTFLKKEQVNSSALEKAQKLNEIAASRGQTMAQMALTWVLRKGTVTTALIGASKPSQIEENVKTLNNLEFSEDELLQIDAIADC